jgi:tetraacyldisaccharide 4'-kinase
MRNLILKIWKGEAEYLKLFLYPLLFFLSRIYKLCLKLRETLYNMSLIKIKEVSIPVVSVGNITLGGTGKTPVVEKLSMKLKEAGLNPGIATRGYKRERGGIFRVDVKNDTAKQVGDEAFMLAKKTLIPVLVGADRAEAIGLAVRDLHINVALLDDGFQLKNIKKDMEILILNGRESGNNYGLFPLGPYREGVERIKDADIILVNKGTMNGETRQYSEDIPVFQVQYKPVYLYNISKNLIAHYNFLQNKNVLAFSGLGDNRSFFDLLKTMGIYVLHEISYPDHYIYKVRDMKMLHSVKDVDAFVTTEKDAVKIAHMDIPENLFFLAIEMVIEGEEEFMACVMKKIEDKKVVYN